MTQTSYNRWRSADEIDDRFPAPQTEKEEEKESFYRFEVDVENSASIKLYQACLEPEVSQSSLCAGCGGTEFTDLKEGCLLRSWWI
ncbi:unnamed protein product [Porites evermanni]|uniref:Uncharacterized protein n=1 Tax=Porites evermanni TaxID=104178 RepID=A0ABN8LZX4_9CNID|nr:unnamed protein product [Porites evermanni]